MRQRAVPPLLAAALALLLVGCPAAGPQTGNLAVTIVGLPSGLDAGVTVTGPGFAQTVTSTATLTDLAVGSYTVSAATVTSSAVTSEYDATVTPASVAIVANQTAVSTVTYTLVGGGLTVVIGGLPVGVDADVTVSSTDGFSQSLTGSQTLTGIDPGVYSASAQAVADGTDSYAPTVTGSPAEVSSSSGATISVAYALEPGSLQVTISGLGSGVDGSVTVTGAGGFSQTLTSTSTLTGLTPGLYALTAAAFLTDAPIVSEAYDVSTPPPATVEVTSNTTASVGAAYSKRPGTGRLWQALASDPLLDGYAAGQLAASGAATPDVALSLTGSGNDEAAAFDSAGNVWVSSFSGSIRRIDAARLESTATVTADITIGSDGSSLQVPVGLAYDTAGNLWVADFGSNSLQMFTPGQLAADGTPTPAVTVGSDGTSLQNPVAIAFDAAGNLWVALFGGALRKFTPAQLIASGTPAPDVSIGTDGTSLQTPEGLAFDAGGNLWVANYGGNSLVMYGFGQLAASGTPTPDTTLGSDGTSLANPGGLAFDNSGNLWVTSNGSQTIESFTPDQLSASGTPTPNVSIATGASTDVGGIAFSPPPANLPITTP